MKTPERTAVEAVARHVGATGWEERGGSGPAAYLTIGAKKVAVGVTALRINVDSRPPRLRFDKVVLRLVGDLRDALSDAVPEGQALIVTVTAPIRLPGRTAEALETTIRKRLARRPARIEIADTVCGNQVRVRLVKGMPGARVAGFVHNPDVDGSVLLDLAQALLQQIGAAAAWRAPKPAPGDRWLVLAGDSGLPVETCRRVWAELAVPTGFEKILIVSADGRVDTLAG
jgi:hypothetical protein